MYLLSIMRPMRFLLIALFLPGCAQFNQPYRDTGSSYNDPYAQSGVDELLTFGASMANMPESQRAELCRSLLNTQKMSPSDGVQLHLMVGRLLSDACGDIPRLLDGINAIKPAVYDDGLQRLIALHSQVLARMNSQSKKLTTIERKQQKVKSVLETKETQETKKSENRLLREKLEAIRSMEKQLDENNDGN